MAITQDELKQLTRLNAAIANRKWRDAYNAAAALGHLPPRVSHMHRPVRKQARLWSAQYQQLPLVPGN